MKHLLLVFLGLAMVGTAGAAEFFTVDHATYQGTMPDIRTPVSFSQNVNTTLIEPVQVACGVAGVSTTQNWYLRRFYLTPDHGITQPLCVESVNFGVEQLQMADGGNPPNYDINVNIYAIDSADAFLFANLNPVGSAVATITAADIGMILTANIVGALPVDPATSDLVVAIDAPDGSAIGAGLQFRPGANAQGALWDAWLAAADCGVTEPIQAGDIGFPDSQTIFVVNGEEGCVPSPTETSSWGQVKALFR
jgi:hypothetical protein